VIESGGVASDQVVGTWWPVGALWCGCARGSAAAPHDAKRRWSSDAWAPMRKAETNRWDPMAEIFLNYFKDSKSMLV
jgi:hypothetical protein